MLTPPDSNFPNPRTPRDKDEWIAVVVALGFLGGTVGWLFTSSASFFRPDIGGRDLSDVEQLAEPLTDTFLDREAGGNNTVNDDTDRVSTNDTNKDDSDEPISSTAQRLSRNDTARSDTTSRASTVPIPPLTVPSVETEQPDAIAATPSENASTDTSETEPTDAESTEDAAVEQPETTDSVRVPDPPQQDVAADSAAPIREPLTFPDLPEGHWAKPYIDDLTARGILNGLPDGTYAPDRPMTRAELAVQVAQAFDINKGLPSETFNDIPADYWAAANIDKAVTTGFMSGYPDENFQPDQTVPRTQVLVTLVTGLDIKEASTEVLQAYGDEPEIPDWAKAKVASGIDYGLIANEPESNGQLRPEASATRAEVAAMLHNALVRLGKIDPIE